MTDRGDWELLTDYTQRNCQDAFGELVSRYAGIVYGAAVRQVRESHAAEDVAQAAFIVLARRASAIKSNIVLGGWLLTVTRYAARDYLKMETRRKKREQAVAMQRNEQISADTTSDLEIDSTLDDAIARLSDSNRDAIVLRFFQGKSFGELAAQLGISEDSARQRVSRSLEKLRKIMSRGRGGIEVNAQNLGMMLATAASTATPDGLAARLTASALKSGAAATAPAALAKGVVTVMAYSKAKAMVVGTLALLFVGGSVTSVGYYVLHSDEPTARADVPAAGPAANGGGVMPGYNWGGGPPQSRPLYNGPPISGIVLSSTGQPVAGAMITYAGDRAFATVSLNRQNIGGVAAHTQADGRFQFMPHQGDVKSIAVQSDEGYGMAAVSSLPATPIRIVPWGRIEGTARIGKNPFANAQVRYYFNSRTAEAPLVYVMGNVQTDAEGHFVVDKAPAGMVNFDVSLPGQQSTTVRGQVEVQSKSTAQVTIGGTGRPIIGKVTQVPDGARGNAMLMVAPPQPPRPPQGAATMPVEERRKLMAAWQATPEYQAYLKRRMTQPIQTQIGPDGRFRIEDVPAGTYRLDVSYYESGRSAYAENVGMTITQVTVPEMDSGSNEEPLNVGEIKLTLAKRVAIGQPVPEVSGTTSDGKPIKLSDFRGKYVLFCVSRRRNSSELNDFSNCNVIRDRYRDDPRLVMLTFNAKTGPIMGGPTPPKGIIDWPVVEMNGPTAQEYDNAGEPIFLIDSEGKLLAKNLNAPSAVARVDEALGGPTGKSLEGAKVVVAHLPVGAPEGTAYGTVPPVTNRDAATSGTFTVVDGIGTEPSNSADRLKDGRDCSGDDAPSQNFFFETGTLEGRLKLDLGRAISVGQVNSYSRHKNVRAPQVYVLYASDGTAAGFDAAPKVGTDPAAVGWKKIAVVDTRPKDDQVGGRYAVSVSNPSGSLGKYRYLLFEMFPSETKDPYGQAFYSEIDVLEAP